MIYYVFGAAVIFLLGAIALVLLEINRKLGIITDPIEKQELDFLKKSLGALETIDEAGKAIDKLQKKFEK